MKMWITKYVLSSGIEEVDAEQEEGKEYVYLKGRYTPFKIGRDIHTTKDAANEAANAMVSKKIESVKKQLSKLEAMHFSN